MRNINYKIHINRELACDLRAVRQLNSAKQYAQALLDCTRLMLAKKHNLLTMGLFGKKKELNQRIEMVLSSKHQRVPGLAKQLLVAIAMVSISMGAARAWVPQVDVTDMNAQARQLSSLTDNQSEVVRSAILRGNVQALQQIIDGGLDINTPMQSDGTALMMAVEAGNQFVVEQLLGMGADPNQPSLGDGNPLIVAARTNNAALAQLLIDHGADVNAIVPYDETPLITASRYGAFTTLKLLVEQGADVNLGVMVNEIGGNNQFRSPLNMANTSVIEDYLRENGATKE